MHRAELNSKPTLGDDFPGVLRQVQGLKESGRGDDQRSVVYQTYTGGATIAQVTALYAQSGVRLLALADIEHAPGAVARPTSATGFRPGVDAAGQAQVSAALLQ